MEKIDRGKSIMFKNLHRSGILLTVVLSIGSFGGRSAQGQEDVARIVTGIVKHVDHEAKVVVVKTGDGTEHTIKYTDRTSVRTGKEIKQGTADAWLGTKEGARVTVRYTSNAGKDVAVGIKDAGEKTAEAVK